MQRLGPALAFVLLMLLAACSSSSSSGTGTPTAGGGATTSAATATGAPSAAETATATANNAGQVPDPCSLLTQDEVAAATGEPVGPGSNVKDPHACEFEYDDPTDPVSLVIATITDNVDMEVIREDQQGSGAGFTITPVTDVGDEAYYSELAGTAILDFRKGDLVFETSVTPIGNLGSRFTTDIQEAAEKQMALDALPLIP